MKVLYLTEWYPHRYDAMSGLFVRKHAAAAVRAGADVCVLYFLKDTKIEGIEIVDQTTSGIREIYVYHSGNALHAMRRGWAEVQQRWGMPHLTQLNVLTKNGLLAAYLRRRYRIPYILVEHWSGYLPENNSFRGGIRSLLMKRLAAKAACILPVSEALEKAMKNCGIRCKEWMRIHNVVDDFFFSGTPCRQEQQPFRFLHVSCFDERSKNTQGILRALDMLRQKQTGFECRFVGTGPDFREALLLSDSLGLTGKYAFFEGELPPEKVKEAMLSSHCFVLFSRYETAGVVLSECLATGLPMIGTRAGAIPEIICDQCGMLVESENISQLAAAMEHMLDHAVDYNPEDIRSAADRYSEASVGTCLVEAYKRYARK